MRIVKEFTWAMAHRLTCGYKGKCRNLHGHTYKCEVELGADELDQFGMVVDFGWIKKMLAGWVNDNLDHAVLVTTEDKKLLLSLKKLKSKTAIMPSRYSNTTAEQIVDMLFVCFRSLVEAHNTGDKNVRLISVTVWETETSRATRRAQDEAQNQ